MLKLSQVGVAYGGLQAVAGVSLDVAEGEFVTIVGPNGAGKTTLMKAVGGGVPLQSGRVEYRGQDISGLPAHARARLGIAHVPEGRKVFPSLTVLENLEMGSYRAEARRHRVEGLETVLGLFPVLRERRQQLAGSLSGGEQQMLAIGRGIMALPDLLLLDEPSQGLGPRWPTPACSTRISGREGGSDCRRGCGHVRLERHWSDTLAWSGAAVGCWQHRDDDAALLEHVVDFDDGRSGTDAGRRPRSSRNSPGRWPGAGRRRCAPDHRLRAHRLDTLVTHGVPW